MAMLMRVVPLQGRWRGQANLPGVRDYHKAGAYDLVGGRKGGG